MTGHERRSELAADAFMSWVKREPERLRDEFSLWCFGWVPDEAGLVEEVAVAVRDGGTITMGQYSRLAVLVLEVLDLAPVGLRQYILDWLQFARRHVRHQD